MDDGEKIVHANFGSKPSADGSKEISEVFRIIKELEAKGLRFLFCLGYDAEGEVQVAYGGALESMATFVGDLELAKSVIIDSWKRTDT